MKKPEKYLTIIKLKFACHGTRWNCHWHGLLLEGGFNEGGNFVYLPISSTKGMTELFRRKVIQYFEKNKLINSDFARNLLSWKNSGFSIDNSVRIFGSDEKARESLVQYIARAEVSLEKLKYESFHGKVLFKTPRYNKYFKENFKVFNVLDFIALYSYSSKAQSSTSLKSNYS